MMKASVELNDLVILLDCARMVHLALEEDIKEQGLVPEDDVRYIALASVIKTMIKTIAQERMSA